MRPNTNPLLRRGLRVAAVIIAPVTLGHGLMGCSSAQFENLPAVGLPANTPARPATEPAYLPVNEKPPGRDEPVLTPAQQEKMAKELTAAREQQAKISGTPPTASSGQ